MNSKSFDNISIRGRVAYVIMCFEKYVTLKYPKTDWTRVDDMMWKICDDSDYIDISTYKYMEIIPEYLYEFDDYIKADFDYLSEEDFIYYRSVIPKDDNDLNVLMHAIYDIAIEYAYVALDKNAPETRKYIDDVLHIMTDNQITKPDIQLVSKYTFDKAGGWGNVFDGRYLSIILN